MNFSKNHLNAFLSDHFGQIFDSVHVLHHHAFLKFEYLNFKLSGVVTRVFPKPPIQLRRSYSRGNSVFQCPLYDQLSLMEGT